MFVPKTSVKQLHHQDKFCSETFNLLCWNVAKMRRTHMHKEYLRHTIESENIDILLLQEVKKELSRELDIYDYSYVLSPNIQTRNHMFGVLSAFKFSCENDISMLTQKKELAYMTHKTSLITEHKMVQGQKLLIVNLHAINFVKSSDFYSELNSIKLALISHKGPMIVAGDFNTWNRKRLIFLKEFTEALALKEVTFKDNTHLKKVFSYCLDYIFYRDLKLIHSKVLDSKKISDHNPIMAGFEVIH